MRYSDLKGRKLVDTTSADTVGKVDGFLLDPATRSVVALEFKKTDHGSVVAWSDLTAVGADAVTIAEATVLGDHDERQSDLATKDGAVLKKRVLSDAGEDLGSVHDIDLDPETGALVELILGSKKDRRSIAGSRLLGVGSYAVVVAAE
ncbi:PRC-barrel domain-containing protein [Nocardioides sp.]|uniref:PRC-barrel domain-containing protein n=1 Tax=Nocardioides sp. TaxID=35761 RepID=UPI002B26AD02|nr:PRC-barrel domain-containing protein [Nocardioides sp.]